MTRYRDTSFGGYMNRTINLVEGHPSPLKAEVPLQPLHAFLDLSSAIDVLKTD